MRSIIISISLLLIIQVTGQQFYVSDGATVNVSDGASLELGGDLENDGSIINNGNLSLYGDWVIDNMFNSINGTLTFSGLGNQTISPDIQTSGLTMESSGTVTFSGNDFLVIDEIRFTNGILTTDPDRPTKFSLAPTATTQEGSSSSYFQGKLSYQGPGDKFFPMGYQGQYAPITILNVTGTDQELTVYYENPNTFSPVPANLGDVTDRNQALLGVSEKGLWTIQKTNGTINSNPMYMIDFTNEEIPLTNDINHTFNSPVIAYSDAPGGIYSSLGVVDDINYFNGSGIVTSERGVPTTFLDNQSSSPYYLAIALAPRIDPDGTLYVPEVFSPNASHDDNQRFRIFSDNISNDNVIDFKLEIYNSFGAIVYTTDSFEEAKDIGWNGRNQKTNAKEVSGTYYYYLRLKKENGEAINNKGALLLAR
ncbi:MAG: hypothetical protein GY816_15750 [Cytophagales bacterium]|nr:hypothetical protein [Cytophagales bacterium]